MVTGDLVMLQVTVLILHDVCERRGYHWLMSADR
jgi:hypothetical protein